MKKYKILLCALLVLGLFSGGCQKYSSAKTDLTAGKLGFEDLMEQATEITLSDETIHVNGDMISSDPEDPVYQANDIVFYLTGQDFTYGEGTIRDAHTQEMADLHTVVHITQPGVYAISGTLSAGQIAVDLGENAKKDPNSVVTLILNNANITCSVAPAVIFYQVYECGSSDTETASASVDTASAGANVIIADGTTNQVTGSYVAEIYKTYTLNDEGTQVVASEKLHKYDGAFYSRCSMNIAGGTEGTGVLNISAENEGLDSEMHLTINGGNINITSGNDGINTNEDGISVTTINDGTLTLKVNGSTGEGDGIDSNGWLVINGGTVRAEACGQSADAGIDSDMGIHVNGGIVMATGHMLDRLEEGGQNYAVFSFNTTQTGGSTYTLKNTEGETVYEYSPANDFTYLVLSGPDLTEGEYTFWNGDTQLAGTADGGAMGGHMPGNMTPSEGIEMPEAMTPPKGMEMPEDMTPPEGMEMPEGMTPPGGQQILSGEASSTFTIIKGGNMFLVTVANN